MLIIPAIDILNGQAVRLVHGDYTHPILYGDPHLWLDRWLAANATLIHVVDLDGARDGTPSNLELIRSLAAIGAHLQVGGGIRTESQVAALLSIGASRVVLGTAAVEDPDLIAALSREYGDRIVVAIDSQDGVVRTRGWRHSTEVTAVTLANQVVELGVKWLLITDIARDGALSEPNYDLLGACAASGASVIASGGVASVEAVRRLVEVGTHAAMVGRALYDGIVELTDLIGAANAL